MAVFGSSAMNSISRGYLYGASCSLTKAFSAASVGRVRRLPGLQHDVGLGPRQAVLVGDADHRRLEHRGCCTSVASTSNGETYWPVTFSMSSLRPQYV